MRRACGPYTIFPISITRCSCSRPANRAIRFPAITELSRRAGLTVSTSKSRPAPQPSNARQSAPGNSYRHKTEVELLRFSKDSSNCRVAPEIATRGAYASQNRSAFLGWPLSRLNEQLDVIQQLGFLGVARVIEREHLAIDVGHIDRIHTGHQDRTLRRYV